MIATIGKLLDFLDRRERRNASLLFVMVLVMGLLEVVGIASIVPLIAVLSNPQIVHTNQYLATVYSGLAFTNTNSFLIFLSASVFMVVVGRTAFSAFTTYALTRYAHMRAHTISFRLLKNYLGRPYGWFLSRHSADMGKAVLSEVEQVVKGSLMPALELMSQVIIATCIIMLIILVQPLVAGTATVVMGGGYVLIYFGLRRFLAKIGQERLLSNSQRFQIAQEALGGIKDVKIGGLEQGYLRRFNKASNRLARRRTMLHVVSAMPRYILEIAATGGILAVVLALLIRGNGDLSTTLPMLALYAFAALRLLPTLQKIYKSIVKLRFGGPALDALHTDFHEQVRGPDPATGAQPLALCKTIALSNVSFFYPNSEQASLRNVTLTIPALSTTGFIGSTGAGKSTVVDVILGLLEPQQGEILVDDEVIGHHNVRSWQKSIGYVPQQIFLVDESIAANIAFGVDPDKIDMDAVQRAAGAAKLHDFIANRLPQGYETTVGERGIRLSGGERQRVGIARALYHDPEVLVLDEATSALDNLTERAVMDTVQNLARRKTVILIAHRLSTVRKCDTIFLMDQGRIKKSGTYDDLLATDESFRHMAGAA